MIKTRSLTESLEKLYEAYEVETEDELDAIMDDDTLSDEEKEAEIGRVLDKHDKLNENESLNEAQLNENPLVAAAARAAIPAAIDVASNAISSVIDAKLNDGNKQDLNEDLEYEIYRDVWNAIYDIADADFISNLVPAVAAKVPAYDPDWFEDEDPSKPKYTMYLEKLVDVLADGLMANYSE